MGLAIYPVFKPSLRGAKCEALGEVLVKAFRALDRLADARGLTCLTAFADNREIPEDFDGSPDELDEVLGPWDEWFDPRQGWIAFQELADLIRETPEAAVALNDPHLVGDELRDLVRVLRVAEEEGAKFRLEMS